MGSCKRFGNEKAERVPCAPEPGWCSSLLPPLISGQVVISHFHKKARNWSYVALQVAAATTSKWRSWLRIKKFISTNTEIETVQKLILPMINNIDGPVSIFILAQKLNLPPMISHNIASTWIKHRSLFPKDKITFHAKRPKDNLECRHVETV